MVRLSLTMTKGAQDDRGAQDDSIDNAADPSARFARSGWHWEAGPSTALRTTRGVRTTESA